MINSIHFLRGIAALLVFVYHVYFILKIYIDISIPAVYNFHIGVDIFFVISGFIIFTVINRVKIIDIDYIKKFITARVIRICPQYITVSIVMYVLYVYIAGNPRDLHLIDLIKSIFFIPFMSSDGVYPVLGVGWTLNYEFFFYILTTICLLIFRNKYLFWLYLIVFTIVIVGQQSIGLLSNIVAFKFWANPIIIEFLVGISIGILYSRILKRDTFLNITIIILIISFFILHLQVFENLRFQILSLSIVLLLLSLDNFQIFKKIFKLRIFIFMGNISYSFYLVHQPVLSFLGKLFNYFSIIESRVFIILFAILSLLLSIFLSKALDWFSIMIVRRFSVNK